MKRAPLKIESVLDRLGSVEVPEDTTHRYELRRELLCSRFFQDACDKQDRWNRFVTFTAPLITGGMLVVVFTFVGSSLVDSPVTIVSAEVAVVEQVAEVDESETGFIDARAPIPMYEVIQSIPAQAANYVLMR